MKKFLSILSAAVVSAFILTGCAKAPTMNAASEQKYRASIEVMSKGMSDSQKQEFIQACEKLRQYHVDQLMKSMKNKNEARALGLAALSDKTVKQILQEAKNL
ncbi:MAG: entry exclusion lipoprotein TrbK [Lentisphaerae bacterium]|nr:entry exclusion lipoprotein TrbK [Lentisphaerota bacterium]